MILCLWQALVFIMKKVNSVNLIQWTTPEISSFKVIVSPAKLHSFSCILGHLLNIEAIEAFQIIFLFELNMSCQTRMCFKLKRYNISIDVMQKYL